LNSPTKDDVREIIRTLKNNKSSGEDNIIAEIINIGKQRNTGWNSRTMKSNIGLRKNAGKLVICKFSQHIRRKINCSAGIIQISLY
jgi:hypothetical protein